MTEVEKKRWAGITRPTPMFHKFTHHQEGSIMHNIQSPRHDDDAIEQQIKAKGLNAPRLSPADLNDNIVDVEIVKHVSHGGQVLRWAILTARNGFAVTGSPSVAVSPENDDSEIGVAVAIANAKTALWPLMGYQLKEQLFQAQQPAQNPV